jgi:hypothetical protein
MQAKEIELPNNKLHNCCNTFLGVLGINISKLWG